MNSEIILSKTTQLELFEPTEIVRPDVNIGKWSGWIFASPWAKDLSSGKEHVWDTVYEGHEVRASLMIRPINGRKRPTTTSYRVFLALIQLWEASGKPEDGVINFSARQLAHMLEYKSFNSDTAQRLHEHLDILSNTSLSWTFSFETEDGVSEQYSDMNLLESQAYKDQRFFKGDKAFQRRQSVRLNRDLVLNMLAGKTKPINYKEFISIRNDSSANLYTLLDIYLSKKRHWQRRARALIYDDLEFSGVRYEQRRLRHAKLKEFVAELDGKDLLNGKLKLKIEKTVDGEDYKLVAEKIPRITKRKRIPPKLANPETDIQYIVDDIVMGLNDAFGSRVPKDSKKTFAVLARWYDRNLLFQALSVVKADMRGKIKKSPIKAFMYQVHVMAHERKLPWIRDCGSNCRYLPESRESLFKNNK